jgi:hypothetical protein
MVISINVVLLPKISRLDESERFCILLFLLLL